MFTYYVIKGGDQDFVFCAGNNPSSNVFEFYQCEDGKHWKKQQIVSTGQEGDVTYYKITIKNSNTTITLMENAIRYDLSCLLINKNNSQPKAFTLTPIHRDKLPQGLILVEDLLAKAPSKKPTFIDYDNDSQEDLSPSFFMALAEYATNNPWKALACALLATTLIAGAVFLTLGSLGISLGLLSALAILGLGSALMAGSSIGLVFVELHHELEKNNRGVEDSLVI